MKSGRERECDREIEEGEMESKRNREGSRPWNNGAGRTDIDIWRAREDRDGEIETWKEIQQEGRYGEGLNDRERVGIEMGRWRERASERAYKRFGER